MYLLNGVFTKNYLYHYLQLKSCYKMHFLTTRMIKLNVYSYTNLETLIKNVYILYIKPQYNLVYTVY